MNWKVLGKVQGKVQKERLASIIKEVLANRGLKKRKSIEEFVKPTRPERLTVDHIGIDKKEMERAIGRIKKAMKEGETIVIYGDYDADGVAATAIIWETLYQLKAKAVPFIPDRHKHGYGLSVKGVTEVVEKYRPKLIITVDNGIVAHEAAELVKESGIDLVISDHHLPASTLPPALAIVHTTQLSGAGVAWIIAREVGRRLKMPNAKLQAEKLLDLATIGTVADMVPLLGANRSIVKWGFEVLRKTERVGIVELVRETGVALEALDTYQINFVIAPRLNAMGRLEQALDSLRLVCTKNGQRARELARRLGSINRQRQILTDELLVRALGMVENPSEKVIIVENEQFHEGVIGLVAGKLTETYYRPSIVINRGETVSKASARSVAGVNIIELIRQKEELLINAGGHPMAAGFTIASDKIDQFRKELLLVAEALIPQTVLEPVLMVDCLIRQDDISAALLGELQALEPYGVGNPRPTLALQGIKPLTVTTVGMDGKHLKLILPSPLESQKTLAALWFNHGEAVSRLIDGGKVNIAFTLGENRWNGRTEVQLNVKDIRVAE
ncbi:single-stranded-DNA-specific exonuclease RecJ [Microgenomates group bacterium RIFCSPHIGHO2_01_FULL_45_11]|nr:MAG: single-stranded-DNA-specific exonuclease RecJ [Microgenomates group bacterium RIFCSPHIGHO2_01_FULL_45_11]